MALSVLARKRRYIDSLQQLIRFATAESGRMVAEREGTLTPTPYHEIHRLTDAVRKCRLDYVKELSLQKILDGAAPDNE